MSLQLWQIALITLLTALIAFDATGPQTQIFSRPVFTGPIVGLILGDMNLGLFIGGTLQLMSMGVVGLGGASVPNYTVTTIIATTIAITTGQGMEVGLAIGLPVGMLFVQLDIMSKIANGFIARWSQSYANKGQFKKMNAVLYLSIVLVILKYLVPVLLSITLGVDVVVSILKYIPDWFMKGLQVSGKVLPVVGIAILLNYMPTKKFFNYLAVGFVFSAYLKVGMLGVAIIGFAMAFKYYYDTLKQIQIQTSGGASENE